MFSDHKVLFFCFAKFEFVYLLKTAHQSEKGSSGCATPKENINRIYTNVDEEHFFGFLLTVLSIWGTDRSNKSTIVILDISRPSENDLRPCAE